MKIVKLGDVCGIVNGGTPKTGVAEYWDGDIHWITPKDLGKIHTRETDFTGRKISRSGVDNSSAKIIPSRSVILSTRAPIGHVVINTVPMAFNQGCRGIVPNDNILAEYLYYFIKLSRDMLNELGTGTTFRELSTSALKGVEIPLPTIEEQRRVVERLDAVFEKIDRAIELTEINITETNLMKSSILTNAFNVSYSKTVKLGDVCLKITDGSHYSPKSVSAGRFPYVTVRDIARDIINFDRCKHISEEQYIDLKKNGCKPEKGDVLFSKDGTVGKVSLVAFDREFVVLSSLAIIRPDQTKILPEYLFHILKSSSFFEQAVGKKSGTAIRRIILRDLKNIEIHIHESLEEQRRVVERLDAVFKKIDATVELRNKKLMKLNELKQSALTQAFSGSGVK